MTMVAVLMTAMMTTAIPMKVMVMMVMMVTLVMMVMMMMPSTLT